ncbi:hypothetical protein LTR16_003380, partial [Cryomyces antarcticus]
NSSPVVHVSFPPSREPDADPFPAILPMIGVMGSFESPGATLEEPMDLYLHGYVSSRLMRLSASARAGNGDNNGGSESHDEGLPVSIAATKTDGIVLALTPNNHSYNYRSAILHGFARPVTSVEENLWAMELLTNNIVPDRWRSTRVPPNKAEMTSTQILKVRIVSASAKIRCGGPHDEKKDLRDGEVTQRVWTGVVPVWERLGAPVPGDDNRVAQVPAHVVDFVAKRNREREARALQALQEPE